MGGRVVSGKEVIESGFNIPFFAGELLANIIADVTLRSGSTTGAGGEFLTERQLEDAAAHSNAQARATDLVFKERAAVTCGSD